MTNSENCLPHHTDARLLADLINGAPGLVARAEYLLNVAPEHRSSFDGLAHTICNRTPGYRYSDGLYAASLVYKAGGIDAVRARIERDR